MKHRRPFHDINFESLFVFHVRNDMKNQSPEKAALDPMNGTILHPGLRAITVVVVVDGKDVAYGIGRCEWKYQFCRKLARTVATGRAKQALWYHGMIDHNMNANWYKQGTAAFKESPDPKEKYAQAKILARTLIEKINDRASAMASKVEIDRRKKEKVVE